MRSPLLLECAYLWAENAEIMGSSQIVNQQCVDMQDLRQARRLGLTGKASFTFKEVRRDQTSVYLEDASRNMAITLNLAPERCCTT